MDNSIFPIHGKIAGIDGNFPVRISGHEVNNFEAKLQPFKCQAQN